MDGVNNIKNNGQAIDCSAIGVKPIKIFSGVNCSEKHKLRLKKIAEKQGIEFEECHLSDNDFSVIDKTDH